MTFYSKHFWDVRYRKYPAIIIYRVDDLPLNRVTALFTGVSGKSHCFCFMVVCTFSRFYTRLYYTRRYMVANLVICKYRYFAAIRYTILMPIIPRYILFLGYRASLSSCQRYDVLDAVMTVLEGERHRPAEGSHWELSGLAAESGQSEEPKEICRGLPKVCTCRLHERRTGVHL